MKRERVEADESWKEVERSRRAEDKGGDKREGAGRGERLSERDQ